MWKLLLSIKSPNLYPPYLNEQVKITQILCICTLTYLWLKIRNYKLGGKAADHGDEPQREWDINVALHKMVKLMALRLCRLIDTMQSRR